MRGRPDQRRAAVRCALALDEAQVGACGHGAAELLCCWLDDLGADLRCRQVAVFCARATEEVLQHADVHARGRCCNWPVGVEERERSTERSEDRGARRQDGREPGGEAEEMLTVSRVHAKAEGQPMMRKVKPEEGVTRGWLYTIAGLHVHRCMSREETATRPDGK